jgi:hypothetical protein
VQPAPQPSPPVHPAQPEAGALVVTTDRAAVDRFYRPLVVVVAVLIAVMLLLVLAMAFLLGTSTTIGDGSGALTTLPIALVMPLVVLSAIANLVVMAHAWGAMRTLRERVVADARGLALTLPGMHVRMPWHAVRSARLAGSGRRERLTLQVDAAMLDGDLPDAQRRRIARRGLVLSAVGMRPGLDAVAHAVAVGTGGRVQAQRR